MDYNRKLGRRKSEPWSRPHLQDRVPQQLFPKDDSSPTPQEDRRLANWRRWLVDRERRQRHLSRALRREPLELALNAHERVRARNEARCLLESACRPEVTRQDPLRGNPAFWRAPERLAKGGGDEGDDVFVRMDRERSNLPPEVTRVALPSLIRKEKMLAESCIRGSKINLDSKWECGDYLQQRTLELRDDIKFLEPKKPEMEDLVVIGRNFRCGDQADFIRTPVITITPEEPKKKLLKDPDERIALKIQDREFVLEKGHHFEKLSQEQTEKLRESKEDSNIKKYAYSVFESNRVYKILSKKAKSITWSLTFETHHNELHERKLILENKGVQIVNVDWRNVTPTLLSLPIPDRFDSCFFFNKNPISILPGQKVEVPIWFRSHRSTVATEIWKLLVEPRIYPGTLRLRLWATSSGDNSRLRDVNNIGSVKTYLAHRVRDSRVHEIVQEIFLTSTNERFVDDVPYDMFFLEADVFRARNPTYFYNSILVNELKEMYKNATSSSEDWNLTLEDLRSNLLAIGDSNARREKMIRFREICFKSLQPTNFYTRSSCSKEKMVYLLLCTFFNRFEDESHFVMTRCCSGEESDDIDEGDASGRLRNASICGFGEDESEGDSMFRSRNTPVYREALNIRINCLLCETMGSICAAVDTDDYFNKE